MIKNIGRKHIIGPACRESFVPVRAVPELQRRGVLLAGISWLYGAYEMGRPGVGFHLLLHTTGGRGWLRTPRFTAVLKPGDLLLAPAGTVHAYGLGVEPWEIVWVHLSGGTVWDGVAGEGVCVRRSLFAGELRHAMKGLIAEAQFGGRSAGSAVRCHAELMHIYLERELGLHEAAAGARRVRARLHRVFEAVNGDLKRGWTVRELAARYAASRVHFTRQCKQHLGMTPMRMIAHLRMSKAAELLRSTDYKLAAICVEVGYSDPFAFSVAFKRWSGQSPRAYRRSGDTRAATGVGC